jgi:hypothetical protein
VSNPADDVFVTIVLALLTPLFRPLVDSDERAREAAWFQVQRVGYGPMTDPLTLVQTIGLGMAAATTLAQAASPDLDIAAKTKLNRAASSFSRTEERQRRVLQQQLRRQPGPPQRTRDEQAADQAEKAKHLRHTHRLRQMIEAEEHAIRKRHPEASKSAPGAGKSPPEARLGELHTAKGYVVVGAEILEDPDTYACGYQYEANARARVLCCMAYEIVAGVPFVPEKPFDLDTLLNPDPKRPPSAPHPRDKDYHRSAPALGDLRLNPPRAAA